MHGVDMIAQRIARFGDFAALRTGDARMIEMQRLDVADNVVRAAGFAADHTTPETRAVLLQNGRDEFADGRVEFGHCRLEFACNN